jgi:hypothetical protein
VLISIQRGTAVARATQRWCTGDEKKRRKNNKGKYVCVERMGDVEHRKLMLWYVDPRGGGT